MEDACSPYGISCGIADTAALYFLPQLIIKMSYLVTVHLGPISHAVESVPPPSVLL